jgi:Tol biopolymer transport system component
VRQATRCDGTELLSFDWTPDGRGLVFGSMVGRYAHRGIRVLDLASGQWRALATASTRMTSTTRRATRPTGKWLVFVRNPQLGDLWRMPAAGGTPEQLTNESAEQRGWAWLDDGRTIVFGRRVDSEARLYYLDVERHAARCRPRRCNGLPCRDTAGCWPSFTGAQFGVFKVPMQGSGAERLFASSGRDGQPMAAPDGRQLVFTSDRSGSFALWWADMQRPDSLRPIEGLRRKRGRHRTGRPTAASCWWSAATRMGVRWSTRSRHAMNACNLCRFRPNSRCRPCMARRRSSCWWSSAMPTSAPG